MITENDFTNSYDPYYIEELKRAEFVKYFKKDKIFNGIYNRVCLSGVKRINLNRRIMPCNNYNVR